MPQITKIENLLFVINYLLAIVGALLSVLDLHVFYLIIVALLAMNIVSYVILYVISLCKKYTRRHAYILSIILLLINLDVILLTKFNNLLSHDCKIFLLIENFIIGVLWFVFSIVNSVRTKQKFHQIIYSSESLIASLYLLNGIILL